jgi:hypothetical protein
MPREPRGREPLTCRSERFRPDVLRRAAAVRVLRDHRERQRLGQQQLIGALAEVDQARRLHALDVAAVGGEIEVGLEDVVFAVARFEPQRRCHLLQLAVHAAAVDAVKAACELHRQRRAATPRVATPRRPRAARQAERVHARVPAEAAVFVELHRFHEARVDAL